MSEVLLRFAEEANLTEEQTKLLLDLFSKIERQERIITRLDLNRILPSLEEERAEKECPICGRLYGQHRYLDFFINDKHAESIRDLLAELDAVNDANESLVFRIKSEPSAAILSSHKKIEILDRYCAQYGPISPTMVAVWLTLFAWLLPDEYLQYKLYYKNIEPLYEITDFYEHWVSQFKREEQFHKALGGKESLLNAHEEHAKTIYLLLRTRIRRLYSSIMAAQRQVLIFERRQEYPELAEAEAYFKARKAEELRGREERIAGR